MEQVRLVVVVAQQVRAKGRGPATCGVDGMGGMAWRYRGDDDLAERPLHWFSRLQLGPFSILFKNF